MSARERDDVDAAEIEGARNDRGCRCCAVGDGHELGREPDLVKEAAVEGVRPQSMAQTIAELEAEKLVQRRPDPTDGRRFLIDLTPRGSEMLEADRQRRQGRLTSAIVEEFSDAERAHLAEAVAVLRRLGAFQPANAAQA